MAGKVVLEMRNITKKFPGVTALDDVNFTACEGEILALCGENGAGKSTLMKILSGAYSHTSYTGEIYINGERKTFNGPAQSEASGIAMIYQEISMHLDMSVAENVFLGDWRMSHGKIDWKRMNSDVREYTKMVGLDIDEETTLRQLSASQQQLVSIARVLSKNPSILVLDEPTSPLTQKESDRLFKILHSLKRRGIACILISHKMDEVFQNADKITVLRDGHTVASYRREDTTRERVISDMVGRSFSSYYPKEKVDIGDTVMQARNFSVAHPFATGRKIIDDVSFSVKKGEVLGVAGLVGAGRSELMNALFGKDKKLSGEVFVNGKKVNIRSPRDAMDCGIGLVTEDRKRDGIVGNMTIRQNLTLPVLRRFAQNGILNLKKERIFAKEYFDSMDVRAPGLDTELYQLSGGNQQKVVLGKWIASDPKILILDEPTRGVDVGAKHEIYKTMMQLVKRGIAIILISSELPELLSMSDRIIVVAGAKIQGEMPASDCSQERIMALATTN